MAARLCSAAICCFSSASVGCRPARPAARAPPPPAMAGMSPTADGTVRGASAVLPLKSELQRSKMGCSAAVGITCHQASGTVRRKLS